MSLWDGHLDPSAPDRPFLITLEPQNPPIHEIYKVQKRWLTNFEVGRAERVAWDNAHSSFVTIQAVVLQVVPFPDGAFRNFRVSEDDYRPFLKSTKTVDRFFYETLSRVWMQQADPDKNIFWNIIEMRK